MSINALHKALMFTLMLVISLASPAATIEKSVRQALKYIHIEQVYDELEQSLDVAIGELDGQLQSAQYQLLKKGMRKGFDIGVLNQDVEAHLIQTYNEANYQKLLMAWDSGFGQMVYDERNQLKDRWILIDLLTLQRSPRARLLDYAEELEENPPSQQRIDLVRELLVSTVDLELHMASRRELTHSLLLSLAQATGETNAQQSIDRHLEEMHEQWLEESASVIVLSYFYIYRHHSDRELQQVVYFYQQPMMQWFNQELKQAYILALEKAGRRSAGYIKNKNQT